MPRIDLSTLLARALNDQLNVNINSMQNKKQINNEFKFKTNNTVRVENFEVVLISRFSWVADDTKIIHVEGHVEGGINTREIF